jgi:hypothetical protein
MFSGKRNVILQMITPNVEDSVVIIQPDDFRQSPIF